MTFWKKTALALAFTTLVAGVASALPSNGFEITYYDTQGNVVGESSYYCGNRTYSWGQVTPVYDRIDFPCR